MTAFAQAQGLTVRHIGRRSPALRDLDLRWDEGERLLLLGPSGSGKSTLALCLDGVIPHALDAHWEAGHVLVRGRDTLDAGLAATTRDVGVVFQDPEAQLVTLEVADEIAFGLENLAVPRDEMRRRVAEARTAMGLAGRRVPERIDQLSGGTKQRLAIASVLAMGQSGIVLDEPTANLDPQGAGTVLAMVAALARDRSRSFLVVEHRLDDVLPLVDRVAVLDGEGRLALDTSPEDAFGPRLATLDALGVWAPQLALLARLMGDDRTPRSIADAGARIAARWPRSAASLHQPLSTGPAPSAPILAARGLTYRFRGRSEPAIDEVSVDIGRGELVAIVGRNGAGKSTLGLALVGAIRPAAGSVLLDGRDLHARDPREIRARLAYVFQYPEHQFVARTVRDELLFGLRARGMHDAAARARANEILETDGLAALALADPHSLSVGQQRRLSVATALVTEPDVLVLDEPTFGQDRRHVEALVERILRVHRSGRTAVIITHDLSLVADRAERVIAMADGRVVFDGTPRALFERADVLAVCGLALPPVAAAFAAARAQRPDLPTVTGLREARAVLEAVA